MRTAFFGTPAIAVPALEALNETSEVVGVVCQPDRPRGRGMKLSPCPVKARALELGLEVHQPVKVKTGNLDEWLKERHVDAALVLAYGRILPPKVLSAPRFGCLNLHASLLPKYRGAAPIQWAIMEGETQTGISLMQMDEGLDTGPVFSMRTLPISPGMTAGELAEAMATLAAACVREELPAVFAGASAVPQDHAAATHAPPIEATHCRIDWRRSANDIEHQVHGVSPRPGAFTELAEQRLKILRAATVGGRFESLSPGTVAISESDRLIVATGDGGLRVLEAQLPGKRALSARDIINGGRLPEGTLLGSNQ